MNDRLKRAIISKTRPCRESKEVGEVVFFKRANDDKWRGPGVVSDSIRGKVSVKMDIYFYPCGHEVLLGLNSEELKLHKDKNSI